MIHTVALAVAAAAIMAPPSGGEGPAAWPGPSVGAVPTRSDGPVLRIARSGDGLDFADSGEVFVRDAAGPCLVRLADSTLLAFFDDLGGTGKAEGAVLSVVRSNDGGTTWSRAKAVRFEAERTQAMRIEHGSAVVMPSGLLRLYFAMGDWDSDRRDRAGGRLVGSAVTRDGVTYRPDPQVRLSWERVSEARPAAAWLPDRLELFVVTSDAGRTGDRERTRLHHLVSADGRRFRPGDRLGEMGRVGGVVALGRGGYRMYASADNRVRSLVCDDGRRWRAEPGVRMEKAADAAVVRLGDGRFLMLYTTTMDEQSRKATAKVPPGADSGGGGESPDPATADGVAWEPFTQAGLEAELGADGSESEGTELVGSVPFAPTPDFVNEFDYVDWYKRTCLYPEEGNAFEAYDGLISQAFQRPDWDGLTRNMIGSGYAGPIGPWDPAAHPDWEEAYQTTQGLLAEFNQATMHPGPYSSAFRTSDSQEGAGPLLAGYMLPTLAHVRGLWKGVISNAWRAEGGVVPTEPMLEGWRTVLRSSHHLREGATLIEHLVGIAGQNLVQETARDALQEGVFTSEAQIQSALATLRESNYRAGDMSQCLSGEHATIMELAQYVFEPQEPGAEPAFREDRVEAVRNCLYGENASDENLQPLRDMTPEQIREGVEVVDKHLRELAKNWQVGYPTFRSSDLARIEETYHETNAITGAVLPSLRRAYEIEARVEASRRATELVYEMHIHKVRTGRWPASLSELPAENGTTSRTDPFTGAQFGYKLTDQGPRVYSVYENGVDDGGIHNPDRSQEKGSSDDYVFWPPQGK